MDDMLIDDGATSTSTSIANNDATNPQLAMLYVYVMLCLIFNTIGYIN